MKKLLLYISLVLVLFSISASCSFTKEQRIKKLTREVISAAKANDVEGFCRAEIDLEEATYNMTDDEVAEILLESFSERELEVAEFFAHTEQVREWMRKNAPGNSLAIK